MSKTIANEIIPTSHQGFLALLEKMQAAIIDVCLTDVGLAIATTKTKVKTAAALYAYVDATLLTVAATDNLITLSGTVVNATFNVFVFTVNSSGTITATMGTAGASLAAALFPTIPDDEAILGFIIINPTGTGNFVGGTTDLDDGTVTPGAIYIDTPYPFNPNAVSL